MLRLIGLFLVALAPVAAGIWRARAILRRERLVRGFFAFAEALEKGVVNEALDQREIYRRFSDRALEERGFMPLLLTETDRQPWGALYRAAALFLESEDPGRDVKEHLLSFAADFGTVGMAEQSRACAALTAAMKEASDREKRDLGNSVRLALVTGAAIGGGILILFW